MSHTHESAMAGAAAHWEHFAHEADAGVRGYGTSQAAAFEQAAYAMSAVITESERVQPHTQVNLRCSAPDPELLLFDWLNALIYAMATRNMLFSEFRVHIDGNELRGSARGETVDIARHEPRVEIKGATFTELHVSRDTAGQWLAQCVLDV
ncbi:MAG: archease [Gammaproteobacteria bacterium]